MNWSEWNYTPSLKQHHRYYRGTAPFAGGPKAWGVIGKARWPLPVGAVPAGQADRHPEG